MITIFNRKEVYLGNSLDRFNETRRKLSENNIKYKYRIVDRNSSNYVGGQRGRTGTFGQNISTSKIYYIYVHKKDYEEAKGAI